MGGESETQKMVKSLKEILHDFSEQEIYAMLVECNMDPNEAVQRLLCQGMFHEVKSKRERRKEMKEMQDIKSRAGSSTLNWGVSNERNVANFPNVPVTSAYKRENGSVASSVSCPSSASHPAAKTINQTPIHNSDSFNAENREQSTGTGNAINSSFQLPKESDPAGLIAGRGKVSIADIVRGDVQHKTSPGQIEMDSNFQDDMQALDRGEESHCSSDSSDQIVPQNQSKLRSQEVDPVTPPISSAVSESHHVTYSGETPLELSPEFDGKVVLPSHVQALAADCSHLTFGTYKSHSSSASSGQQMLSHSESDLRKTSTEADDPSNQLLYSNEQFVKEMLESMNGFPRANQDSLLVAEMRRQQNLRATLGYELSSTESDSNTRNFQNFKHFGNQVPSYAPSSVKEEPHAPEVPSYSHDMLGNLKAMQSNMGSSVQYLREPNLLHSTSRETLSENSIYTAAASSMKNPPNSASEAFLGSGQLPPHMLPHQFIEQPPQPVNWSSTRNIPQNYGRTAAVEHPGYPGGSDFHQSLRAVTSRHGLVQYSRREDPLTNLPVSNIDASGRESLWSSTNNQGGFLPNASVASNAPAGGYEDIFQPQFNGRTRFSSQAPVKIGNSPAWDYGARSGSIPNARDDAYYSLLEAQERNLRRQQDQQFGQNYAYLGNDDVARTQEDLLHGLGDMTLSDSNHSRKQNQFWQQRY